jgi:signal transduction histidine kinase
MITGGTHAPFSSQVALVDDRASAAADGAREPASRKSRPRPPHRPINTDVYIEAANAEYFTFTTAKDGQLGNVRVHGAWLGESIAPIERERWVKLIHPDDWKAVAAAWEHAVATRSPYVTECRIRRLDGVERRFSIHVMPQFDARGRVRQWAGFGLDITAQHEREWSRVQDLTRKYMAREHHDWSAMLARERKAVADLERAQDQLEAIQSITDAALSNLALDDLLREVLRRVEDLMGVDNVAILLVDADGMTLRVRAARGTEEPVASQVRVLVGEGFAGRIAATGEPLIVDNLSTAHTHLPAELHTVVGVALLVQDRLIGVLHAGSATPRQFTNQDVDFLTRVADRVALAIDRANLYDLAQAAREDATKRAVQLETTFEAMPDAVLMYDQAGRIVRLNQPARALYTTHQVPGFPAGTPEDRVASVGVCHENGLPLPAEDWPVARMLRGEVLGGAGQRAMDFMLAMPDGQHIYLSASGAPLYDAAGQVAGAVMVMRDITERRRLEHDRAEARARELAALEINQNLDDFFTTAAHDIRNPAAIAKARAQMAVRVFSRVQATAVSEHPELADDFANVLENLIESEQGASSLVRLVARLFDIARARAGQLEIRPAKVDLAALVREQVEAQRVAAPDRQIALEIIGGGPVHVLADADRLGQVLANYVTNAVKYSPRDEPVTVCLEVTDGMAVASVTDHGPGLPLVEQYLVWDMFHRAPGVEVQTESRGSLGLGLSICKRLVEMHPGGKVGVESELGNGATFWFRLPVVCDEPPA